MEKKAINHYWFGSKFPKYCVKKEWHIQEGKGRRCTKWYPTDKGKKALKKEFGIEV